MLAAGVAAVVVLVVAVVVVVKEVVVVHLSRSGATVNKEGEGVKK